MYDQTLPYYLGRTVTQVEHDDELAMGIASEICIYTNNNFTVEEI